MDNNKVAQKLRLAFRSLVPRPQMWRSALPILGWLPPYSVRQSLPRDLVTGLTVGIMVVPQAMAYTTLAGVEPVYGLYTCFFAALFYMFVGTSRHISVGTFAVASMMVGAIVAEHVPPSAAREGTNGSTADGNRQPQQLGEDVTPIVLTSALTLAVGIVQLLMALCRLSFLTVYISDPLVSGFTTGAAFHVLTSQLGKLIGVHVKEHSGPGLLIFMWRDLARKIGQANLPTVLVSAFGLCFLAVGRECVSPHFQRRFRLPLPLELILVIGAIGASSLFGFKRNFGISVINHVPSGMPLPALPRLDVLAAVWPSALSLALVCYVFVFSLGKMFAKKHKYSLSATQELYALGVCSSLAALFPVYPFGASLARSSLCEMTGAKTPLHALFSSALLLVVILFIGPLLQPLPTAILGCIVAVSLKPLFLQVRVLPHLWRVSIYDCLVWLVAFWGTLLLDITWGLGLSALFSAFTVVLREQRPRFRQVPSAAHPIEEFGLGVENVQIWRFECPLHFANAHTFLERVNKAMAEMGAARGPLPSGKEALHRGFGAEESDCPGREVGPGREGALVLDCSAVSHIDSVGVDALAECHADAAAHKVRLAFANCSESLLATLRRCGCIGGRIPEESFLLAERSRAPTA